MIVMYVNITLSDDSKTVVTIDNSTLESISSQITTAVSTSEPSYGIKAGSGSIVFKDVDKQFVSYSKEGYLNSSNRIDVYLQDTIHYAHNKVLYFEVFDSSKTYYIKNDSDTFEVSGISEFEDGVTYYTYGPKVQLCGTWMSKEWNFDTDNETITITLRDGLEKWQDIEMLNTNVYSGIDTTGEGVVSDAGLSDPTIERTAYYILQWLQTETPSGYTFDDLDEALQTFLKSINIEKPYMDSATLWTFYDNLCQLGLLYIYKNLDGTICVDKIR